MTETMISVEPVKKPTIDEDDKISIGQKLGAILRKYPNSRQLRDAKIPITLTVFEKLSKGSSKGNLMELEGLVEGIDFTQNRVVMEGRRIKLGEIVKVSVPSRFEDEDDYGEDAFSDDYAPQAQTSWDTHYRRGSMMSTYGEDEWQTDIVPVYHGDHRFVDSSDDFADYFADDVPDYEAEVVFQRKETQATKRPKKTILYSAKTGYRSPYAARA